MATIPQTPNIGPGIDPRRDDPWESETENLERHLVGEISRLQREYQAAIKPYVDELIKIRSLSTRTRVMIDPAYVPFMPPPTC